MNKANEPMTSPTMSGFSSFWKLGSSEGVHIGAPIPGESPYWSRITVAGIEVYREVFEEIPKFRPGLVFCMCSAFEFAFRFR